MRRASGWAWRMSASDNPPQSLEELLSLIGARGSHNDLLLRVNRVLAGDRGSACERLGMTPKLIYEAALATFNTAQEAHFGKAPGGAEGAQIAAIGDVFLAGLIVGSEVH